MSNYSVNGRRPAPQKKTVKKKKRNPVATFFKKFFMVIATTLLSLFLVMIITGTIVATALTVYVLDFMEEATSISLSELESGSDTYFYGTELDENGEPQLKVLQSIKTDVQRIPVSIDKIPQHVRNAFVTPRMSVSISTTVLTTSVPSRRFLTCSFISTIPTRVVRLSLSSSSRT